MALISIMNQKGGVGKTTISYNLSYGLAKQGKEVLLIDLDPQGSVSLVANLKKDPTIYAAFADETELVDCIQSVAPNLSAIASSPKLVKIDAVLDEIGKDKKLKALIRAMENKKHFDYIIIDTPPALGTLTVNAMTASDWIVIPAETDSYSLKGISQIHRNISLVKENYNNNLKIAGIVINRYKDTVLSNDLIHLINSAATKVHINTYKTTLREYTAYREAQQNQINIFDYAPESNASIDFMNFITETKKIIVGNTRPQKNKK